MKGFLETIRKAALGCILLYVAIFAALFLTPVIAISRIARQFLKHEPLVIAPGWEIKLP